MDLGLGGKTALVFGGSKGLGRGTAEALAAEGTRLALVARDPTVLDETARTISERFGVPVHAFPSDLADAAATLSAVSQATTALGGRIDILINNTGGPPPGPVAGVASELWEAQFRAMVLSVFMITNQVLPAMRANGWGRVLTVASTVVIEPNAALGLSNALRSTLVGWSKTLAGEVAGDGVTVNLLLPGQIATDRTMFLDQAAAARAEVSVEEIKARKLLAIPAGRYGTPLEFGAVAAFLASEQAAYVTGTMMRIDGGVLRSV